MGRPRSPNPCMVIGARVPMSFNEVLRAEAKSEEIGISQLASILLAKGWTQYREEQKTRAQLQDSQRQQ